MPEARRALERYLNPLLYEVLNRPMVWNAVRCLQDVCMGLYRTRFKQLRSLEFFRQDTSVLDVGCGIGHYSQLNDGRYLGLDFEQRYIDYATKRYADDKKRFAVGDVTDLEIEQTRYDVGLLVDIIHHIADEDVVRLVRTVRAVTDVAVVVLDNQLEQSNPVGRWLIAQDRGDHIRPYDRSVELLERTGLRLTVNRRFALGPVMTTMFVLR